MKMKQGGGLLVGESHANGGIKIATPEGQIEAEGGEIIITKKAAKEHCEELSAINQSGGGVAIPCNDMSVQQHSITKAKYGAKIPDTQNIDKHQLAKGIKVEKEHKDLYERLKKDLSAKGISMPMSQYEFYHYIASAHLREIPNYYTLLDHMEKTATKKMAGGGAVASELSWNAQGLLKDMGRMYPTNFSYDTTRKSDRKTAAHELLEKGFVTKGSYANGYQELILNPAYIPFDKTYKAPEWLKEGEWYDVEILDLKGNPEGRSMLMKLNHRDWGVPGKEGPELGLYFSNEHTIKTIPYSQIEKWLENKWIVPGQAPVAAEKQSAEPEKKEEKSMEEEIVIPTNINNSKVDRWDMVPAPWKNIKPISAIKYINSPYDKNLLKILDPFFSTDVLRPQMTAVNFDEHGITCTDAHKLIHLPYPNAKYHGMYATGPVKVTTEVKDDLISGKYPNYPAVIPKYDSTIRHEISVYKLLQYAQVARMYANKVTNQAGFKFDKDRILGFNCKFLEQVLESILMLGHEKVYAFVGKDIKSTSSRTLILSPDENYEVGKSEIFLLMSVMFDEPYLGAMDMDFQRELKCYYDFSTDEIRNGDGSLARFHMNYGEYTVLDSKLIKLLGKYRKNGEKSVIPILNNFIVEKGVVRAVDLKEEWSEIAINVQNSGLQDGAYQLIDGAIEFDAFVNKNDYPKGLETPDEKKRFVINSSVLKYYLDKAEDFVSDDDLRPQMTGYHLTTMDGKVLIYATNAHILMKADITRYCEMNKNAGDYSAIIPKSMILNFLDYLETDEPIIVATGPKHIRISCSTGDFVARLIDAKYPNAEAVIPKNNPEKITINIKELYGCLKSPEAVAFYKKNKKEIPNIFDIQTAEGKSDIFMSYNVYEKGEQKEAERKKICEIDFTKQPNDKQISGSLVLIMPVMKSEASNFAFGVDFFKTILDTCSSESITLYYSAPNRAYIVSGEDFDFSQTVSAKVTTKKVITPTSVEKSISPQAQDAIDTLEMLLKIEDRKEWRDEIKLIREGKKFALGGPIPDKKFLSNIMDEAITNRRIFPTPSEQEVLEAVKRNPDIKKKYDFWITERKNQWTEPYTHYVMDVLRSELHDGGTKTSMNKEFYLLRRKKDGMLAKIGAGGGIDWVDNPNSASFQYKEAIEEKTKKNPNAYIIEKYIFAKGGPILMSQDNEEEDRRIMEAQFGK